MRGLGGAWEGYVSSSDLRPALLNPHSLIKAGARLFVVPREPDAFYLLPRDRAPQNDLSDYIRAGERIGVNRLRLVQTNSTSQRWYCQSRSLVTSRWALPYSSGYDYGAVDNSVGAVLNGRFVGVEALNDVDEELLGAVLNTTFVILARLLEGTTTGVEGAFDVGPPAVRRMRVPDVRRFNNPDGGAIVEILAEMRERNEIPPAPDRYARADRLRNSLDIAVLRALGSTKGRATAITSAAYESYARWRTGVESVEQTMRGYRREMSRHGRARSAKPADIAARRIWEEIEAKLPLVPGDLLTSGDRVEEVDLSRGFRAPNQEPLFQAGVVPTSDGELRDLESFGRVRYASMLLELGFEPPLLVLRDASRAAAIADLFAKHTRDMRKEAASRSKAYVSDPSLIQGITDAVQRYWHRKSRTKGMRPPEVNPE